MTCRSRSVKSAVRRYVLKTHLRQQVRKYRRAVNRGYRKIVHRTIEEMRA